MEYTILTLKGQITIPKEIREKFNWKEGTRLKFFIDGEELKVKEVTILDEMEDLITKDLIDLGYSGEGFDKAGTRYLSPCPGCPGRYETSFSPTTAPRSLSEY